MFSVVTIITLSWKTREIVSMSYQYYRLTIIKVIWLFNLNPVNLLFPTKYRFESGRPNVSNELAGELE